MIYLMIYKLPGRLYVFNYQHRVPRWGMFIT